MNSLDDSFNELDVSQGVDENATLDDILNPHEVPIYGSSAQIVSLCFLSNNSFALSPIHMGHPV